MWNQFSILWLLTLGIGALVLALTLCIFFLVPWQAHKRGYSFSVWLLACLLSLNPLLVLLVLIFLPDRRRLHLRRMEMAALEEKLALASPQPTPLLDDQVPRYSIGDQATAQP